MDIKDIGFFLKTDPLGVQCKRSESGEPEKELHKMYLINRQQSKPALKSLVNFIMSLIQFRCQHLYVEILSIIKEGSHYVSSKEKSKMKE